MRYELWVGLRYTRAKRRNHFISFISLFSMLGMALGVATLIVVLSVMNGFQKELRTRILSVVSHIEITGGGGPLADWRGVETEAKKEPRVVAAAPYVQAQSMLVYDQTARGVIVRGIDPAAEEKVVGLDRHMKIGSLDLLTPGQFNIILGIEIARALNVDIGDKVTLVAPEGMVTPAAVMPRLKQFRVVGVFEVGNYEYDSGLALINIEDAQKLYRLGDAVSGVRLKVDDLFAAPAVARELLKRFTSDIYVSDWTQGHANFFRAVAIEKTMMMLILFLIVAVAAFNIISTLVMAVVDKQADIAILRTLGASPGGIMQIFMVQGAFIGVVGLALGVGLGVTLALNLETVVPFLEQLLGVQFLDKSVYYISELPSDLHWRDVGLITGVSFALTVLATLYPSWRAARVNPAEALRYE
jgi:lipoprotein-releasing system permease protein